MKTNRIREIEEYIISNGTVSMQQLCDTFEISMNTARRDIRELVRKGTITKVYGGVTVSKPTLVTFEERSIKNHGVKTAIARAAAGFVEDGDIIYIDAGTTPMDMVNFLQEKSVTILTNNLNVIINAIPYPQLNVISLGGAFSRKTNSFHGFGNTATFRDININKAFMAATGVSMISGVTNSLPTEYEIKKSVVEKSSSVYLLADSSKFNVSSLMTYCRLSDIHCVITEKQPPSEYTEFFEQNGVRVIVV